MSYTKTQWTNDIAPAINETNLNKIEQGIYDNDSAITTANANIGDLSDLTTTANTDLVSAINEVDGNTDINTAKLNGTQVAGDMVVDSIRTKNMLDTNKAYVSSGNVTIVNPSKGKLDIQCTSGFYSRVSVRVPVTPNETYTLSYTATISSGTSAPTVVVRKLNDSTTIMQETGEGDKTITFSTTESGVIISFFATMTANTGRILYENIQLEEGSTATTYTPYQELDNQEVYSATEQRIGTWINGKPLYRKVVSITVPTVATQGTPVNETKSITDNIDNAFVEFGYIVFNSSNWTLPATLDEYYINTYINPSKELVIRSALTVFNGTTAYVSVKYTKTTD